jgi:uncharacterized protein (DUF305 family)
VVALGGCGAAPDASSPTSTTSAAASSTAQAWPYNGTDVSFASQLLSHHVAALSVVNLANSPATNPRLRDLAGTLTTELQGEVTTLTDWLRTRGLPALTGNTGHSMPGMDHGTVLADLQKKTGPEFDAAWLAAVRDHYGSAAAMADDELKDGYEPGLKSMAQQVASKGRTTLAQLQKLQA